MKENAKPETVATLRQWRGRSLSVVGERLRDVIDRLQRETLDVEVVVVFLRRVYAGGRSGARPRLRLVGVRDARTGSYNIYVTNIAPERVSAEEVVARVPACRWQIELLFKEMEWHQVMEGLPSRKGAIVERLPCATVVTLVVSHLLMLAVRQALQSLGRSIPEGRWEAIFATVASDILNLLLAPLRAARERAHWLEAMLLPEAVDPDLSQRLLLARVENAVTW